MATINKYTPVMLSHQSTVPYGSVMGSMYLLDPPLFLPFSKGSTRNIWLLGGPGPPLWKIWLRQLGRLDIPNIYIYGKMQNWWQPNHQPAEYSPLSHKSWWLESFALWISPVSARDHPMLAKSQGLASWLPRLRMAELPQKGKDSMDWFCWGNLRTGNHPFSHEDHGAVLQIFP